MQISIIGDGAQGCATRRAHMVKTVDEFFTMQEILDFLKAQADGRAPGDDEAGVLSA